MATKKNIRVVYWVGTSQREELVGSYAAAMRVASRNRNAFPPAFFAVDSGDKLVDDGRGLVIEDSITATGQVYAA